MKKLIALLAAAFVAAPVLAAEFPDISIGELKTAIAEKKVTVIDVNGSGSYAKGHVPTAIDYAAVSKDLASKLPADKSTLIVAYCGGPSCNAYQKAAKAAKELGYTNVKHLSAGISGWLQAGEATEK
jgi:rhodanese-related sulfurtransferase